MKIANHGADSREAAIVPCQIVNVHLRKLIRSSETWKRKYAPVNWMVTEIMVYAT